MKNLIKKPRKELENPNINVARRIIALLDYGLPVGLGAPIPGEMCVEAAVCFAMGQTHEDAPNCVHPAVSDFKIRLNDSPWSSNKARGRGLKKIAIAQLGSNEIDGDVFLSYMNEHSLRLIPMLRKTLTSKDGEDLDSWLRDSSCWTDILWAITRMSIVRNVDKNFCQLAAIGVEALQAQKSKACKWLHLVK